MSSFNYIMIVTWNVHIIDSHSHILDLDHNEIFGLVSSDIAKSWPRVPFVFALSFLFPFRCLGAYFGDAVSILQVH